MIKNNLGGVSMSTFNELVNQIDKNITNQRDRGTAFEKLLI